MKEQPEYSFLKYVLIISIFLSCCLLLSSFCSLIYYPFRLYYTGEFKNLTVQKKYTNIITTQAGSFTTYHMNVKELNAPITTDPITYWETYIGKKLNAFVSTKADYAIVTDKKEISLYKCLTGSPDHPIIMAIIGAIVLIVIGLGGLLLFFHKQAENYRKFMEEHKNESELKRYLLYVKEIVPHALLTCLIYLIFILASKAVLSVESSGQIQAGFVLLISYLGVTFGPVGILSIRQFMAENKLMKNIILVCKIGSSLFLIVNIWKFMYEKDLTQLENMSEVLKELWDFLID